MLVTLDPIVESPYVRPWLDERFTALRAAYDGPETVAPLFAMHIADVERLLRYTNACPFAQLIRDFTRGGPGAKYRAGPMADYVISELKTKGVKPGRDTLGQQIETTIQRFARNFKEQDSKTEEPAQDKSGQRG